ncbi:MAG: AlbA family DNA-binding domain-containing protein [Candidatus Binataceae bacterium]
MTGQIPLGQRENQTLEFKSAKVLKHLASVGREVVAMLNTTNGGRIWIGLADSDGIAVQIEPIANADFEIGRIRDHCSDSIEPSPVAGEVTIDPIADSNNGTILRISVKPTVGRSPYALREGTARQFLKRVDDRVRPMSREEIFSRFDPASIRTSEEDKLVFTERQILERRNKVSSKSEGLFWLIIRPVREIRLSLDASSMGAYFTNASLTGNRATGWTFVDRYESTHGDSGGFHHGGESGPQVTVTKGGQITFSLPLRNLYWKGVGGPNDGDPKQIWPYCLLEFPISVFRLASTLYTEHPQGTASIVLADLAMFGLRGWTLRPRSPQSFAYLLKPAEPFPYDDLMMPEPLRFTLDEILTEPDRCGFRLVQQVYERFGYSEDEIPQEFDRVSGKLTFPSG